MDYNWRHAKNKHVPSEKNMEHYYHDFTLIRIAISKKKAYSITNALIVFKDNQITFATTSSNAITLDKDDSLELVKYIFRFFGEEYIDISGQQ